MPLPFKSRDSIISLSQRMLLADSGWFHAVDFVSGHFIAFSAAEAKPHRTCERPEMLQKSEYSKETALRGMSVEKGPHRSAWAPENSPFY